MLYMHLRDRFFFFLCSKVSLSLAVFCKVSIPELMQSMEKAIDVLRSRYKVPTTPV